MLTTLQRCTCRETGDRLSEYLDRELDAVDDARVGLHLAACPVCAQAARLLAATIRAVHRLPSRLRCPPS